MSGKLLVFLATLGQLGKQKIVLSHQGVVGTELLERVETNRPAVFLHKLNSLFLLKDFDLNYFSWGLHFNL
jgi:hypothetical protein